MRKKILLEGIIKESAISHRLKNGKGKEKNCYEFLNAGMEKEAFNLLKKINE